MYTIYDIAKLSNVSKSTVSRVLNNHPYVSKEKRERVEQVIKELQYSPNQIANQFRTRRTDSIGILVPLLDHPYFSTLVQALSQECNARNVKPVVFQTFFKEKVEEGVYEQLKQKNIDGLICTSSSLSQERLSSHGTSGPIVMCNESFANETMDVFVVDEEQATYDAVSYLIDQGRTRIGFCSDVITHPSQQARLQGYKRALGDHQLPVLAQWQFEHLFSVEDGLALAKELFQKRPLPLDGLFAGSDFVAAGIVAGAKEAAVAVPEELAIIGFDNHPISLVTDPPLTTIANPIAAMARDAVTALLEHVNGKCNPAKKHQYTSELLIRGSA